MNESDGLLSIVVPVFNEIDNLQKLHQSIAEHASLSGRPWELVLVDDGSSDGSSDLIRTLAATDLRVRYVQLSRNFGQQVAICAGLDAAAGELIMLMDADLQDPPEEIPRFIGEIEKGFDLVFGVREGRRDSLPTRVSSRIFWASIRRLSGFPIPENLAVMRIFTRRFLNEFKKFPERQKFIEGIFMWIGLRRTTLRIAHRERHAGKSKYNLLRKLQLATTAITAFSERPLTAVITAGSLLAVVGLGLLATIVVLKLTAGYYAQGWVSTFGIVLFVGGLQTLFLGVLGKYIGRLFTEIKQRPLYIVQESSPAVRAGQVQAALPASSASAARDESLKQSASR